MVKSFMLWFHKYLALFQNGYSEAVLNFVVHLLVSCFFLCCQFYWKCFHVFTALPTLSFASRNKRTWKSVPFLCSLKRGHWRGRREKGRPRILARNYLDCFPTNDFYKIYSKKLISYLSVVVYLCYTSFTIILTVKQFSSRKQWKEFTSGLYFT